MEPVDRPDGDLAERIRNALLERPDVVFAYLCGSTGRSGSGSARASSDAAGQRNILVHLYLEVDPELIHRTLREDLDGFSEFARRIEGLL